eukprot:TRINITY_DN16553_c0_g1_i1.p1 TRINITY_DN16553_c0_g1~~TRINITY_DN16553_c0_g1_i1.p1  ORF type:complete len:534 (+),score=201.16 TRINITY_DN16553_c0_g1_i1:168-1769(+)
MTSSSKKVSAPWLSCRPATIPAAAHAIRAVAGAPWAGRTAAHHRPGSSTSPTMFGLAVVAAVGFTLFGYDTGVVSGSIDWVEEDLNITRLEAHFGVASTTAAAAVFALVAGPVCERAGRRGGVQVAAVLYLIGALGVAGAQGMGSFCIGRVLLGAAIGIATTAVPMYVAETAPAAVRGRMMVVNDFCVVAGQVLAGAVNVGCDHIGKNWRLSMGLAAVPAVMQLLGTLLLPESPRWLLLRDRYSGAQHAMRRLRTDASEADADVAECVDALQPQNRPLQATAEWRVAAMWKTAAVRRAMVLGLLLMAMNQFSGINAVMYFSKDILLKAGFGEELSTVLVMICDVAQLLGVCVSLAQMDRLGRRHLALRSCVLVTPCLLLLAIALWSGSEALAVIALMAYLVSFGIGLSAVPWTVNSEIYPTVDRSTAQAQATCFNWICNSVVTATFLPLFDAIGGGLFLLYAAVSVGGGLWLRGHMPETMGLSLEQIDALFRAPLRESVRHRRLDRKTSADSDMQARGEQPGQPALSPHEVVV